MSCTLSDLIPNPATRAFLRQIYQDAGQDVAAWFLSNLLDETLEYVGTERKTQVPVEPRQPEVQEALF